MSRRGNCYDNAVMESLFSTVRSELGEHFDSHGEAKMELFEYVEVFYNQRRRHSERRVFVAVGSIKIPTTTTSRTESAQVSEARNSLWRTSRFSVPACCSLSKRSRQHGA
jgi:hypothetical protein